MSGAIARWDAFLAQIENRHREVLSEAEAAARRFIASVVTGGDIQPLSLELTAVRERLHELETKIIDTWHAKVDQAIDDDGLGVAERDREYAKGLALQRALDDQREELEPRLFAELARQRYASAQLAPRVVVCSACGTQYEGPIAFRAVELACGCGARMVFEPGELMRSVAAIGAHAFAQEAAVAQWRAMRAAERRMHDLRPPRPLQAIVDHERSQIAYWQAYLAVRAQLEPELARDPVREIASRMEAWYVSHAEYEESWVAAGRPRTPISAAASA